jgi:SAM-dependent methyltransferase
MDRHGWDERYGGHDLLWSAEPNRFLVDEVAGLPPGTALDLACGEGRNAVWLAELGWDVTAVDFSAVGLAKGRRLAAVKGVRVRWVEEDVVESPAPHQAFDLVLVLYLHLPAAARTRALGRAADAVAPGGTLLVVGHDRTNLEDGWGGPRDPEVLYGPDDVVADLTGLEVVKAERVTRVVDTDAGPMTAIDVLVRATRGAA